MIQIKDPISWALKLLKARRSRNGRPPEPNMKVRLVTLSQKS